MKNKNQENQKLIDFQRRKVEASKGNDLKIVENEEEIDVEETIPFAATADEVKKSNKITHIPPPRIAKPKNLVSLLESNENPQKKMKKTDEILPFPDHPLKALFFGVSQKFENNNQKLAFRESSRQYLVAFAKHNLVESLIQLERDIDFELSDQVLVFDAFKVKLLMTELATNRLLFHHFLETLSSSQYPSDLLHKNEVLKDLICDCTRLMCTDILSHLPSDEDGKEEDAPGGGDEQLLFVLPLRASAFLRLENEPSALVDFYLYKLLKSAIPSAEKINNKPVEYIPPPWQLSQKQFDTLPNLSEHKTKNAHATSWARPQEAKARFEYKSKKNIFLKSQGINVPPPSDW
eukprot:GDKJ01041380.1.p1 GENE.GDKJ01041380.1~~GDKJ01041380.1.p1  ORF type:complete len:349 (+),score=93.50 GDKJ01041380.1:292-1338(+)